jgi:Tfp pilus assembly protein PilF
VARDPQYAQAWALLGKLNARLAAVANFRGGSVSELRAEALAAAHHAIALKPSLYDARIAQALASRENDDTAEWRKQADAAIRINPRLAEGYALLADSYLAIPVHGCARDVNAPLAEEFYRRALLIDPRFGPAYANLSAQLGYAARPDDALRVAEEGLALLPNYISLHTWRAESLLQLNRLNDAELALQPIARLRTPSAVDLSTLMFLDLRRGNLAGAKDRLNLILSTRVDKRSEPTYLIFAGAHYFDAGDPGEAISVLDRAFTLEAACARRVAETPRFARHRAVAAFGALLAKFHGK